MPSLVCPPAARAPAAVAAQSFADLEQLLHRDLATLITDARWLRHYAAAALRLQGNALLGAAEAFGPLPAQSPPARKLAEPPSPPPGITGGLGASAVGGTAPAFAAGQLGEGPPPHTPDAQLAPLARFPVTAEKAGAGGGPHSATV